MSNTKLTNTAETTAITGSLLQRIRECKSVIEDAETALARQTEQIDLLEQENSHLREAIGRKE